MTDGRRTGGPLRQGWRVIRLVVGFVVLVVGLAMLVLPGPAIVVIPMGLAILATEFVWARRLLERMKAGAQSIRSSLRDRAHRKGKN